MSCRVAKSGTRTKKDESARAMRPRAMRDLIGAAGGAAFRRFGFVQHAIVSRWAEIVGVRYAAVSCPESIRFPPGRKSGGVLTLLVEGAHGTVMQHVAPTIVERVNVFFGYPAVDRISFRQGQVPRQAARAAPPSIRPVPQELGDSLREVADPELRACLEGLARGLAAKEGAPSIAAIPVVGRIGERKA